MFHYLCYIIVFSGKFLCLLSYIRNGTEALCLCVVFFSSRFFLGLYFYGLPAERNNKYWMGFFTCLHLFDEC